MEKKMIKKTRMQINSGPNGKEDDEDDSDEEGQINSGPKGGENDEDDSDKEGQINSGPKGGENDKDDSDEDGQNNSGPKGGEDDRKDSQHGCEMHDDIWPNERRETEEKSNIVAKNGIRSNDRELTLNTKCETPFFQSADRVVLQWVNLADPSENDQDDDIFTVTYQLWKLFRPPLGKLELETLQNIGWTIIMIIICRSIFIRTPWLIFVSAYKTSRSKYRKI